MRLLTLPISQLTYQILPYTKPLNQEHLVEIKESIEENAALGLGYEGLLYPIHVWSRRDSENPSIMLHTVLQGRYRTEAFRLLGRERIDAFVHENATLNAASLVAIDTTLKQQPVDVIERGELLLERARILMEAKQPHGRKTGKPVYRQLREQVGLSQSSVIKAIHIANYLTPKAKSAVREAGFGGQTRVLMCIADAHPEKGQEYRSLQTQIRQGPNPTVEQKLKNLEAELTEVQLQQLKVIQEKAESGVSTIAELAATPPISPRRKKERRPTGLPAPNSPTGTFIPKLEPTVDVTPGDWWELADTGSLICGSPLTRGEFAQNAPSARLAIAPLLSYSPDRSAWNLDWLAEKADVVVVPTCYQAIIPFAQSTRMPWRTTLQVWLWEGKRLEEALDLVIFSESEAAVNEEATQAISVDSWRELMEYIVSVFSRNGEQIISAGLDPTGSILEVAAKGNRQLYAGEENLAVCQTALNSWKKNGRKLRKEESSVALVS